ncbi:MAG: hypothetical protein WKF89_14730 [Chitinophagaceae bacterium]
MRSFFLLTVFASLAVTGFSQPSDFISVKKRNNRTLRSYFTGSAISCQTVYGNYLGGMVYAIRNDSVFIKEYDVRSGPNMWGVAKTDTLGTYVVGVHYKDIEVVDIKKRQSFGYIRNGTLLIVGGLGYAVLNIINGKYLNESITGPENRKSLGIALGVAGTGFLMNRLYKYNNSKKRRYRIEYIRMEMRAL